MASVVPKRGRNGEVDVFRRTFSLVFAFLFVLMLSSFSFASPYPVLDYASTGEDYAVSDCGSASVDISTGQLTWSRGFLAFDSSTTYNIEFGLNYVSDTTGNPTLGASPWRHTYDIRINYIADPASLSLTTALGTVVPFYWDAQASLWRSTASYGLFLTCAVGSNPLDFTLSDKYGNTILFDDLGRPITITDRFNRAITLAYYTQGAASGLLYTVTDMWSRSIELIYDNTPLLTDLIDNTAPNSPSWLQFGIDAIMEYANEGDAYKAYAGVVEYIWEAGRAIFRAGVEKCGIK